MGTCFPSLSKIRAGDFRFRELGSSLQMQEGDELPPQPCLPSVLLTRIPPPQEVEAAER